MVVGYRTQKVILKTQNISLIKRVQFQNHFSNVCWNRGESESRFKNNKFMRLCSEKQFSISHKYYASFAKLSPQEVNSILRANEYSHEFTGTGSVRSYDCNQLASNNPIEDTRSEATCLLTTGLLLGVFDGHGGAACAQVISKRLYKYISACLLPAEALNKYYKSLINKENVELIHTFNDKVQFVDDIREIYNVSFLEFITELKGNFKNGFEMRKALESAFLKLDEDLSREAIPKENEKVNMKTLSVAMSGAVACVTHIDGPHLHVANVGDCCAVLGVLNETNSWTAKKLTKEHNTYNQNEVDRIIKEHPYNECDTVIKMERLLGQLAPLRSMGDFRYKWSKELITNLVVKHFGEHMIPPNYYTPPYLSSKPDVTYHKLTPRDKFLVLATDGLWDIISPLQVVRLVGEHMSGKVTLSPLKLPRKNMCLSEINEMLLQRKEGLKIKPQDSNAATHLIRHALGGTEYGIDHNSVVLSLLVNSLLLTTFMFQHSFMALPKYKEFLDKLGLSVISRSIYNLLTSIALMVLVQHWSVTTNVTIWNIDISKSIFYYVFIMIHIFAWSVIYTGCLFMDMSEILGVKQVYYSIRRMPNPMELKSADLQKLYGHMRHPSFTAFAIILWTYPVMSLDRYLLASLLTAYMYFAWNTDRSDYHYQKTQYIRKTEELSRLSNN